jgi:hypothetical protein
LLVLAAIGIATVALIVLGDPLAHPETGAGSGGERGIGGGSRLVEIAAILAAFVLAFPSCSSED